MAQLTTDLVRRLMREHGCVIFWRRGTTTISVAGSGKEQPIPVAIFQELLDGDELSCRPHADPANGTYRLRTRGL